MTIKALITLAILGSSSVAMARPVTYSASAEASFNFGTVRPTVRDHRTAPVIVRTPVVRTPVRPSFSSQWNASYQADSYNWDRDRYQPRALLLEQGMQFENHEYRKDIMMNTLEGRFNTLKIDNDGGVTPLMKVVVEFADGGAQQQIDINRTLRGSEGLSIDLSGSNRKVFRVLIYRADGAAALNMNLRHNGEFTVSAL